MFVVAPFAQVEDFLGDAERKEITAPRHLIVSFREEPWIDSDLLSQSLSLSATALQCRIPRRLEK
jgi:hypothetical protein